MWIAFRDPSRTMIHCLGAIFRSGLGEDVLGDLFEEGDPPHRRLEINTAGGCCLVEFASEEDLDAFCRAFEEAIARGERLFDVKQKGLRYNSLAVRPVSVTLDDETVSVTLGDETVSVTLDDSEPISVTLDDSPLEVRVTNGDDDAVPVRSVYE